MQVNDREVNASLLEIIYELKKQLNAQGIMLFNQIRDMPNDVQVCCPYHKNGQERKPSAGFRKSDGVFHCFTCNETHSLCEVISHCFGKDDAGFFGYLWITKNFMTISLENRKDIDLEFNRYQEEEVKEYVTEEELDKYRYLHPYWTKRGITDEKLIELFDLGYDIERECITFPVKDEKGNCLFIARRSVNTKYFNYPCGAKKPVYGAYELTTLDSYPKEVIICESMLDALSFWQVGKYAVALNGLGSSDQYKLLSSMPCRKFILCTDNDDAGMTARKILRASIKNHLITEYVLPTGKKDANECSQEELFNLLEIF